MKRVIIIGCPGSGKSTFARRLHDITGIPLYHLDMMYWNADRTTVDKKVFLERLQNAMRDAEWIIDGNYASTMEMRIKECDTVFFLDYPSDICLSGITERIGKKRSDMPWIEKDNMDEEFIDFVKKYNSESRPDVVKLLEEYSSKSITVFASREESEKYLLSLRLID